MTEGHARTEREVAAMLAEAAATAGHAPSVHNTQPWRWQVQPDRLELYADRHRQLAVSDPQGRLLLLSCGAALHHARLALGVQGREAVVDRLPDPQTPDLLARITPGPAVAVDPAAVRQIQAMQSRHTDRRPLSDEPLDGTVLDRLRAAALAEGVHLHLLGGEQVYALATAADRAGTVEAADERQREELAYWTGRQAPTGTGLPEHVRPASPPQTTVPARDFGAGGTLPIGPGHDRAAVYGVLFGAEDEPVSWLRAGEALSAVWLTATGLGASVLPLSGVVELPGTRETLRQLVAATGWPYLVLRLGVADPEHAGPAHTPRLDPTQVVDTSAVRHLHG